jgi:MFS transporter, NNP family, nitrate/nitrite transporter
VPCQVWSTGFFDKNVVGTANAFIAGFGNAGGGVTYFLMPTIYDSLVNDQGYSPHVAWRITFIVPGVVILTVASGLFFLCDDTPTGSWANRHLATQRNLSAHGIDAQFVDAPKGINNTSTPTPGTTSPPSSDVEKSSDDTPRKLSAQHGPEAPFTHQQMLDTAQGDIINKPTLSQTLRVMSQPQTLVLAFCYFNSFGAELAINSVLGSYYQRNFPSLGQTHSGQWAAMFGLLNVVTRPLGGIVADILYKRAGSGDKALWVKKFWIHFLGIIAGVFNIVIGVLDSRDRNTMFGLIAGMAVFLEAGNGANFALVPHVNGFANGVVSGVTGATGNLGGIMFAIVFRYVGTNGKSFWIVGLIGALINVVALPIRPVSRKQIGAAR